MGGLLITPATTVCRCGDALEIRVNETGSQTILTLSGELDAFSAPQLDAWLAGDVVLVMRDVTFIDSSGVGVIVRGLRDCDRVVIRDPSPIVRRVLDLVGLLSVIER